MTSRRADAEGIDEEMLLESIRKRPRSYTVPMVVPTATTVTTPVADDPPPQQPSPPKETAPRKKKQGADYEATFIEHNEIKDRKCVYISRDSHDKTSAIVKVVCGGKVSIGGYVDMVLQQHFEEHKDVINARYMAQRDKLL
ncbi:MAG: DUF3408 domain-containing protein [Rikenellaceae bacterium]